MSRGKIIIIVAPSGTGKSTLLNRLQKDLPQLSWSVSCTTRPPRDGERDGVDYFFLNKADFEQLIEKNEFVEWANVHSNYYGTRKKFIDQGLDTGKLLLFDLDVQGCDSMKDIYGDEANIIFIEPPSVDELEKRLKKRATDTHEVITERLNNAKKELKRSKDFDYCVVNDDFDSAYDKLYNIVWKIIK